MDRRGGCCISRYTPEMGYDTFKVNNIMLRFRPIAPKPPAPGSVPNAPAVQETAKGTRRKKRKYVRSTESTGKISKNSGKKKKAASPAPELENQYSYGKTESCSSSVSSLERDATVVTLPLLPEKPDRRESPAIPGLMERTGSTGSNGPVWLSECHVPAVLRGLGSWVIVEGVTGTWKLDGYSLGRSDREKLMNLERDTCPGLTSDDFNRVTWTNSAYRDMVGRKGGAAAWVVLGDGVLLPATKEAALTCRVRVVTCGGKEESYGRRGGLVVLCDVWRMDGGGFAWRLDTELSLRLGVN